MFPYSAMLVGPQDHAYLLPECNLLDLVYRVSQKEHNPRKEAQFERVKINFNARTCVVWLKYHGISPILNGFILSWSLFGKKNRVFSIPGW